MAKSSAGSCATWASRGGVIGVHVSACEVGSVEGVHAPQAAQVEGRGHPEHPVGADLELGSEQIGQVLAHVGFDFEAERLAETPAAQLHLDGDQQVVRLVLFE